MYYRLTAPILAIKDPGDGTHRVLVMIASGSIVSIMGEVQRCGLIEVVYSGETAAMFWCDLQDRAEIIGVDLPFRVFATGAYRIAPR